MSESPTPPLIVDAMDGTVSEKDPFGMFVTSIIAYDPDDDNLWYSIKGKSQTPYVLLRDTKKLC